MEKVLALLFLLPALCLASSDTTPPVNQAAVNITGGLIRHTTVNGQYVDATGTGDAILALYPTADPVLYDGYRLDVGMALTNTIAAPTFAPTLGGVLQTAHPITKQVGLTIATLVAGDMPAIAQLAYDLPNLRWILLNPATINTSRRAILSAGIIGTIVAASPTAGTIGEHIAVTVATPGIALTTGVVANVTSQLLQAGDYDVSGQCNFLAAATTSMTIEVCGISTTTAALGTQETLTQNATVAMVIGANFTSQLAPLQRIKIIAPTTIYLVARGTFTVSTLSAYGSLKIRRAN